MGPEMLVLKKGDDYDAVHKQAAIDHNLPIYSTQGRGAEYDINDTGDIPRSAMFVFFLNLAHGDGTDEHGNPITPADVMKTYEKRIQEFKSSRTDGTAKHIASFWFTEADIGEYDKAERLVETPEFHPLFDEKVRACYSCPISGQDDECCATPPSYLTGGPRVHTEDWTAACQLARKYGARLFDVPRISSQDNAHAIAWCEAGQCVGGQNADNSDMVNLNQGTAQSLWQAKDQRSFECDYYFTDKENCESATDASGNPG